MKDYVAIILTLILVALIYIGYTMTNNTDQTATTNEILQNIDAKPDPADYETNYVPNLYNASDQPAVNPNNPATNQQVQDSYSNVVGGKLCFPSEQIPPLDIYMQSKANKDMFQKVTTAQNDPVYRFTNITPGKYVIFAYAKGNNELKGAYTKAVPCGLSITCNDHTLIELDIKADSQINYADLCDWYTTNIPKRPD